MTEPAVLQTVNIAERVYGSSVDAADPAELLHEASKLWPATIARQMVGVLELEHDELLQISSARSVRRNPALPVIALPAPERLQTSLADVLERRRSVRRFAATPLRLEELTALLHAAYGVTSPARGGLPAFRAAPSGGGLYPLELFVAARRVEGLEAGIYHYDALEHVLRRVAGDIEPAALSPHAEIVEAAGAVLILTAVFWRSRFKYGLRAYRFTLLEAGHATQNALLAATALDLGSIVLGGFFDGRVDALLGLDGVNESSLVLVCVGQLE